MTLPMARGVLASIACLSCFHTAPCIADETVWTTLRVTFGEPALDITEEVSWFSTDVGIIEEVVTSSITGQVRWYDFSEEFSGYGDGDNEYANLAGDIGVDLDLPGDPQLYRMDVEAGTTEVVIDLSHQARLLVKADSLDESDIVQIEIQTTDRIVTSASAWRSINVPYYLEPGEFSVSLRVEERGLFEAQEVMLEAGEVATISFTFE